jgi:flagellar basal-body rod modification protein FlgD
MSTIPISSMAALSPQSVAASSGTSSSAPSSAANLDSQSVFLQLLVAQLKNQDPAQPTDGTAFVTELAQFTTLQEDTTSATDLNAIVAALPGLTPTTPAPPTVPTTPNGTPKAN